MGSGCDNWSYKMCKSPVISLPPTSNIHHFTGAVCPEKCIYKCTGNWLVLFFTKFFFSLCALLLLMWCIATDRWYPWLLSTVVGWYEETECHLQWPFQTSCRAASPSVLSEVRFALRCHCHQRTLNPVATVTVVIVGGLT